jgi:hypothetical protein
VFEIIIEFQRIPIKRGLQKALVVRTRQCESGDVVELLT